MVERKHSPKPDLDLNTNYTTEIGGIGLAYGFVFLLVKWNNKSHFIGLL